MANNEAIEMAERLARWCRTGATDGFVACFVKNTDGSGDCMMAGDIDPLKTLGLLEMIKVRIISNWMTQAEGGFDPVEIIRRVEKDELETPKKK